MPVALFFAVKHIAWLDAGKNDPLFIICFYGHSGTIPLFWIFSSSNISTLEP